MSSEKFSGIRFTVFGMFIILSLISSSAFGALFLNFDGVDGDSQDADHDKWIDILTVNWNISVSVSPAGGSQKEVSKPVFSDITWTQVQDKSFPALFSRISDGTIIKSAEIDFTTSGGKGQRVFFELDFDDVILTSLSLSADANNLPAITGSFTYSKVEVTFIPQDDKGGELSPINASYDLASNKGSAADVASLFAQALNGPVVSNVPLPGGIWLFGSLLPYLYWRGNRATKS